MNEDQTEILKRIRTLAWRVLLIGFAVVCIGIGGTLSGLKIKSLEKRIEAVEGMFAK